MTNLFGSFSQTALLDLPLNWLALLLPLLLFPVNKWLTPSTITKMISNIISVVNSELLAVMKSSSLPGVTLLSMSLFWIILSMNVGGLIPYIFTPSSHPSINLALALPLWLGHMVLSLTYQPMYCASHLVPLGAPTALLPFLVIIECISSVIRPLTLTVRLTANMTAGHLLLCLVGGGMDLSNISVSLVVFSVSLALIILESAVACVQAYVFTILSTLYLEEVNSATMT